MHIRNKKNDQAKQNQKEMKNPTRNDVPFSAPRQKNTDEEEKPTMDMLDEDEQSVDGNKPCKFNPIVIVDNTTGKTYHYKYFRPYKYDWRLLLINYNGESIECTCPRARIHDKKCVWYNPNYINIPDTRNDLSISEQAAQGKIYDMYQNTQNGQQESCGCGTAAEIAYLGHKSTCEEFQWIHERSSYEMLLANLKKRKKVTLFGSFSNNKTRDLDYNLLVILAIKRKSQRMPKQMSTWTILPPQILHPVPLQYWLKWLNPIHPKIPYLILLVNKMVELIAHVRMMKKCQH